MASHDFVARARRLVDDGQFQEAVKICRLGLLAQPKDLDGRLVLGAALVALSRHDEVLAEMRVALEIDGRSAEALALKGEALLRKGDPATATEILERARTLVPHDEDIRALYQEAAVAAASEGEDAEPELTPPPASEFEQGNATKHYPIHSPGGFGGGDPAAGQGPFDEDSTLVADDFHEPAAGGTQAPVADDLTREVGGSSEDAGDSAPSPFETGEWFRMAREEPTSRARVFGTPGGRTARGPAMPGVDPHPPGEPGAGDGPPTLEFKGPLDANERPTDQFAAPEPSEPSSPSAGAGARPPEPLAPRSPPLKASRTSVGAAVAPPQPPGQPAIASSPQEPHRPPPRPPTPQDDDMQMIRAGLGLEHGAAVGIAPSRRAPPGAEPTATVSHDRGAQPPAPRRRWAVVVAYLLTAAAVGAGAVVAGLQVREHRLGKDIAAAHAAAEARAAAETFPALLGADAIYTQILELVDDEATRAARARIRSRLAFEHGYGRDLALADVSSLGDRGGGAAAVARAYAALVEVRADDASNHAAALGDRDAWLAAYLEGQAALLRGDEDAARDAFARADDGAAGQGRVLLASSAAARRRGDHEEAAALLERAQELEVAGWRIERARLAAAAGEGDHAEAVEALESLVEGDELSPRERVRADLARAELARAAGDREGARAVLDELGEPDDSWDWALTEAGAALALELGSSRRARSMAGHGAKRWPDRDRGHVLVAKAAKAAGDSEAGLAALGEIDDIHDRAEALALRGRIFLLAGNLDEARNDLDRALELEETRAAVIARAQIERLAGNPRGALDRLEPLRERVDDAQVEAVVAGALRERGDETSAREILQGLIDRDDLGDAEGTVALEWARLERDEGRFDAAETAYARALEVAPRLEIKLEAAAFAIDLGRVVDAAEALAELAAEAKDNPIVLATAGKAHALVGELDDAEGYLDRAEEASAPPEALLARERGRVALLRRDPAGAKEALERAASRDPHDEETWLLLITAHAALGEGEGVQKAVESVVRRFGGDPVAELARGRNHLYHGRQDEAVEAFEAAAEALAEASASPRLQAAPLFRLGRVRYDLGELDASVAALERAVELDASLAGAHILLGNVRFEREEYEEATRSYEASLAFDRSSAPEAWFYLGDAARRAGDDELAAESLRSYLEHDPEGDFAKDARRLLDDLE